MGYNISGLIIRGQTKMSAVEALFEGKCIYLEEVDFEDVVANCREKYKIDVLKTEDGALIIKGFGQFCDISRFEGEIVQFVVSDVTDTYYLEKYTNGNLERRYISSRGEITDNFGEGIVGENEDFANLVWKLADKYMQNVPKNSIFDQKFRRYGLTLFYPD